MKKHGFSLIEILVVVTIIGVLMGVGFVSYSSVNKSSRDARRKADLEQIRAALEMYRSDVGTYPVNTGPSCSVAAFRTALAPYLPTMPTDPRAAANYDYDCITTANDYDLFAGLETITASCQTGAATCGTGATCSYRVGPYGKECGP